MKRNRRRKFVCPFCKIVMFGNEDSFKYHLFKHKPKKSHFKCEFCTQTFIQSDQYKKHLAEHQNVLYSKFLTCDECGKKYIGKRNLINHLATHNLCTPVRFVCNACGCDYCEERLLKKHIRKHHLNLQNKAPNVCRKNINDTWIERVNNSDIYVQMTKIHDSILQIRRLDIKLKDLETNAREEEGYFEFMSSVSDMDYEPDKKGICQYCNKVMLKKSLRLHIRERHLGIRKFVCETCKYGFHRHYQFLKHICFEYRPRSRYRLKDSKLVQHKSERGHFVNIRRRS